MATKVELTSVGVDGSETVVFPETSGDIVNLDSSNVLSEHIKDALSSANTLQDLVNVLGDMALESGEDLVRVDNTTVTEDGESNEETVSEIRDTDISLFSTWSSMKINQITPDFIDEQHVTTTVVSNLRAKKLTIFNVDSSKALYKSECPLENCHWIVEHIPCVANDKLIFAIQNWYGMDEYYTLHRYYRHFSGLAWSDFEEQ